MQLSSGARGLIFGLSLHLHFFDCLSSKDRRVAGSSLTGGTALWPSARHFILCLVLVQCRKTHPDMMENC